MFVGLVQVDYLNGIPNIEDFFLKKRDGGKLEVGGLVGWGRLAGEK